MMTVFLKQQVIINQERYIRNVWTTGGELYYADNEDLTARVQVTPPQDSLPQFFDIRGFFRWTEAWATKETTTTPWYATE